MHCVQKYVSSLFRDLWFSCFFLLTPLREPDTLEVNVSTNNNPGEDCAEQDDQPCLHVMNFISLQQMDCAGLSNVCGSKTLTGKVSCVQMSKTTSQYQPGPSMSGTSCQGLVSVCPSASCSKHNSFLYHSANLVL